MNHPTKTVPNINDTLCEEFFLPHCTSFKCIAKSKFEEILRTDFGMSKMYFVAPNEVILETSNFKSR